MNLKTTKQRPYHHQTPIKRSQNSIQLAQFFSRPSNEPATRINNNSFDKENIDPNIQQDHKTNNGKDKQNSNQRTPKRKVIHLKSISKNSKSIKNGNSGSMGKKYSMDHIFTEVADFTEHFQGRPAIKIDIDLKNHRKSMQDTLVSSNAFLEASKGIEQVLPCDQHSSKKATFMVKGRPYCDKCSVKLITKGFVAVKIKANKTAPSETGMEFQKEPREQQKNKRDTDLKQFIEELDKMDTVTDSVGRKLDQYLKWAEQYFSIEGNKLEENWQKLMKFLQSYKCHLSSNFKAQEEMTKRMLQEARIIIKEQTSNLSFMRNDIVRNIDRIIDESTVPYQKYAGVMDNFRTQLREIRENTSKIQENTIVLPRAQLDLYRIDQQFHKGIGVKYMTEQLFPKNPSNITSDTFIQGNTQNLYRMSFGRDAQRIQSPTFKVI